NGLLYNDGTGKFNPNVPITREYVAFMVGKAIEMSVSPLKIAMGMGFSDTNTIRKDFVSAVATTVDYGIVKGYPDGTFGPKKNITRAEASKIMTMGIELICDTTLAMPGIEQTAYAWVAEDVNGTTEVRKCDGVTRRLVKTEQEEAIVFFPLTSVSQWEPWGTTRYVNQGDDLMIEAISKGLVLERQKIGLAPEGGNTTYYSYMQNIAYETVLTYFYEVYKPITKTVVSTKDSI
ncbi:MAG: S-layer homology domain-containing protein, partial [Clostridia bacterium]